MSITPSDEEDQNTTIVSSNTNNEILTIVEEMKKKMEEMSLSLNAEKPTYSIVSQHQQPTKVQYKVQIQEVTLLPIYHLLLTNLHLIQMPNRSSVTSTQMIAFQLSMECAKSSSIYHLSQENQRNGLLFLLRTMNHQHTCSMPTGKTTHVWLEV